MIVFGMKDVEKHMDKGTFYCPTCRGSHVYEHVEVSPYFTIYFFPVWRIKRGADYIECAHCHNTFLPGLIEQQKYGINNEVEAEFRKVLKRMLILTMLADKAVKPVEIREASRLYLEITGDELSKVDIINEKKRAEQEKLTLSAYLQTARFVLNESGKEALIMAASGIAACDNELHLSELSFIQKCADALGLTERHLDGILRQCNMTVPEAEKSKIH